MCPVKTQELMEERAANQVFVPRYVLHFSRSTLATATCAAPAGPACHHTSLVHPSECLQISCPTSHNVFMPHVAPPNNTHPPPPNPPATVLAVSSLYPVSCPCPALSFVPVTFSYPPALACSESCLPKLSIDRNTYIIPFAAGLWSLPPLAPRTGQ